MTTVWTPSRVPAAPEVRAAFAPELKQAVPEAFADPTDAQRHLLKAAAHRASFVLLGGAGSGRWTAAIVAAAHAARAGDAVCVVAARASRRAQAVELLRRCGTSDLVTVASDAPAGFDGLLVVDDIDAAGGATATRVIGVAEPFGDVEAWAGRHVEVADGRVGAADVTPYGSLRLRVFAPLRNAPFPDPERSGAMMRAELERTRRDWARARVVIDDAVRSWDEALASGDWAPVAGEPSLREAACAEPTQPRAVEALAVGAPPVGEIVALAPPRSVREWVRAVAATDVPAKEHCAGAILAADAPTALDALVVHTLARSRQLETAGPPPSAPSPQVAAARAEARARYAQLARSDDAKLERTTYAILTEQFTTRGVAKAIATWLRDA